MVSTPGMLADSLDSDPQEKGKGKCFLRLSMQFDNMSVHLLESSPVAVEDLGPCLGNKIPVSI